MALPPEARWVFLITTLAICCTLSMLTIRLYLRTHINGPLGWWDDGACIAATLLGLLHSGLTLFQLRLGLGRHNAELAPAEIEHAQLLLWLSNLLYVAALAGSMLSVIGLNARLVRCSRKVWISYGVAAATALWALVAICVFAFQCRLPQPWRMSRPRHCIDLWAMYASIDAVKIALECANIATAVVTCWGLQMPLKPKLQVVAAFSVRLLVIPPSILRLRYTHLALFSADWSYQRVMVVITVQVILHLSIVLATVPCSKPFLDHLDLRGRLRAYISAHSPARSSWNLRRIVEPVVGRKSTSYYAEAPSPGVHEHRFEHWEVTLRPDRNVTTTVASHDPRLAKMAALERVRTRSIDSELGITRTDSIKIVHEDADGEVGRESRVGGEEEAGG